MKPTIVKINRMKCGLTQAQMALVIGVTEATYVKKENGKTCFTNHEMEAFLAEVKKVDEKATLDSIFL